MFEELLEYYGGDRHAMLYDANRKSLRSTYDWEIANRIPYPAAVNLVKSGVPFDIGYLTTGEAE